MGQPDDKSSVQFWDRFYREGLPPWDAGRVPQALKEFLAGTKLSGRVLVPGCGSGYEVRAFAESGFDVTAIDISPTAVNIAHSRAAPFRANIILGDFFTYYFGNEQFDIVYERTFLCSQPRSRWKEYARRIAELVRPGGLLLGFFLYWETESGPPFGLKQGDLESLFEGLFIRLENCVVTDSIPLFTEKERWQIWKRS